MYIDFVVLPVQPGTFLCMRCALGGVEQADTDFDILSAQVPFSSRGSLQSSAVSR